MWLKRTVAVAMIITCLGMSGLVVWGLFFTKNVYGNTDVTLGAIVVAEAPTVTMEVSPNSISASSTAAITWSTTANPHSCTASGSWNGDKTPFGAESTGRMRTAGSFTYTLTCVNDGGTATASAVLSVVNGTPVPSGTPTPAPTPSPTPTATYCGGRSPCYGAKDIASHGSSGNCWGWNGDRVINITGLDVSYHKAKTGISTIEVSGVCGKDLASSLSGGVEAGGSGHDHKSSTKSNADRNEIPYFVGYYDAKK